MTNVTIQIVTWNSVRHLRACFAALEAQTYKQFSIMVVDNASMDGTVMWLREHVPHIPIVQNTRNLGYSRAHNQAILLTKSQYVLVLNPDVILEPTWLQETVTFLETHKEYGSAGGKSLRFTYSPDELKEVQKSGIIDSAGLVVRRSRYCTDRGAGQSDAGQFSVDENVFGLSGSCALYRRSALESVRFGDEYFDDTFFAYKEDVDLAWRLQHHGWKSRFLRLAVAYHHREIQGVASSQDVAIAKNHRRRTTYMTYLSLRNHWLMLRKNEHRDTFWPDAYRIVWHEGKKIGWILLTRPQALRAVIDALRLFRLMAKKAKQNDERGSVPAREIAHTYFTS